MCGLHEQARRTGSGGVLQSAWLFLFFCANSRATCSLRSIPPLEAAQFAAADDDATWSCLTALLGLPFATQRQGLASLPFASGGCGLRSAMRSRVPAGWASLADSLRMIQRLHLVVADIMIGVFQTSEASATSVQQLHATTLSVQWDTMLLSGGHSRQPSLGRVSTNVFLRDLVSRHSTASSWRSMPLSSHSCAQTVSRTDVARMRVASLCRQLDVARSGHSWWCSQARSAVASPRRRTLSFASQERWFVPLRSRVRQSWMHRWGSMLVCAATRAFASSLLDRRGHPGVDGDTRRSLTSSGTLAGHLSRRTVLSVSVFFFLTLSAEPLLIPHCVPKIKALLRGDGWSTVSRVAALSLSDGFSFNTFVQALCVVLEHGNGTQQKEPPLWVLLPSSFRLRHGRRPHRRVAGQSHCDMLVCTGPFYATKAIRRCGVFLWVLARPSGPLDIPWNAMVIGGCVSGGPAARWSRVERILRRVRSSP